MRGRVFFGSLFSLGIGLAVLAPGSAFAFDAGGFAGGLLGGIIGSAMRQPRGVVVVRPRYRVVTRHAYVPRRAASVAQPRHAASTAAPAAAPSAVVNPSADPFSAAKPSGPSPLPVAGTQSGPTPLPVANKP